MLSLAFMPSIDCDHPIGTDALEIQLKLTL